MAKEPLIEKPTVAFDYVKGPTFRTVHADGVAGNVTPRGDIHCAFFSERVAIARRVVHVVNEDGTLGEVTDVESRNSVVREMDINVVMSYQVATELFAWLGDRIAEANARKGE